MSDRQEDWDLVIKPQNNLFDLNLKDIWRYRDLLRMFVLRDFRAFYKQTVLGPVWFFIQPLFTMGVYIFVFGNLAGLSTDGVPQPLFYLAGIICWTYFQECLLKTANVFRTEGAILGKVYFPRVIMPLSVVVSNLIRFGVQLLLFVLAIAYFLLTGIDIPFTPWLFLFPILIICLALQGLGMGMIISAMTTKYRDLALLLTFGIQLLMYTTTVVYPLSSLGGNVRTMIALNPMTPVIEGVRKGFFGQGVFDINSLTYLLLSTFVLLFFGLVIFNKVEKTFVDTV
ncbi:MAG: ABC transporter permease [Cyclobacteriaceae bacterium]